jgi:hypothetical protein
MAGLVLASGGVRRSHAVYHQLSGYIRGSRFARQPLGMRFRSASSGTHADLRSREMHAARNIVLMWQSQADIFTSDVRDQILDANTSGVAVHIIYSLASRRHERTLLPHGRDASDAIIAGRNPHGSGGTLRQFAELLRAALSAGKLERL